MGTKNDHDDDAVMRRHAQETERAATDALDRRADFIAGPGYTRARRLKQEADAERVARASRNSDRPKQWMGTEPVACDHCHQPFGDFFIDGRMHPDSPGRGLWALLCVACHPEHGVGFGMGRGQKYETKSRTKVEG
jgi:hypothetical protein